MKNLHLALAIAFTALILGSAWSLPSKTLKRHLPFTIHEPGNDELEWHTYIDDAFKESKKTGKPIMANFTGSDWCGWCIRLHKEVFAQDEFIDWAEDNVVLLELDYPKKTVLPEDLKTQNTQLQQTFAVRGFPTIWMFNMTQDKDSNFEIQAIGKTGYVAGGPGPWIAGAESILANAN